MSKLNTFIDRVISEAALDARIESGMVDLKNAGHIQVVAETMYDICENEDVVNEFVSTFLKEGKYPDRQAFNKDGWLVTFPSKEYRDAAIKKGTHSISDPTHGKGGMNLYYKRRGKQKRQTQQVATATRSTEPEQKTAPAQATTQPTATTSPSNLQGADAKRADRLAKITGKPSPESKPSEKQQAPAEPVQTPEKSPTKPADATPAPEAPKPAEAPAIDVPVVTTPPEEYASISKKFAAQKGWIAEPYGEYRDVEGNTVAVVGLSGEVVPVKNNDREEYKLFAEKSKV